MNASTRFWMDRGPAERILLIAIAVIAVLALVIAFIWLPLERTRARLVAELPALRASAATLERQAGEAKRLRSMPALAAGAAEPLASLVTAGGGGSLPGAQISVLDGKTIAVTGADIGFGTLLEWIAGVQASQGLRVQTARIEALPADRPSARRASPRTAMKTRTLLLAGIGFAPSSSSSRSPCLPPSSRRR
jgi:type II secretory pathway component PulM